MQETGGSLFRPFGRDLSAQAPKPPSGNRSSGSRKHLQNQRDWARISSVGFEFAFTVGGLAFLGWKLDQKLGWADVFPFLLLVGVFLGMGLGIYRMNYTMNAWVQAQKDAQEDQSPADSDQSPT